MPQFFMKGTQKGKKRKPITKPAFKPKSNVNEKIESEEDEDILSSGKEDREDYESESDHETAQSKRLRLAKEYIKQLEAEEIDNKAAADIDKDAIAHRLQQDVLEDTGQLHKFIADKITPDETNIKLLKGHKLSLTCVVISSDNKLIYSASKDGSIIKWDMTNFRKLSKVDGISKKNKSSGKKGHVGHIFALAISSDSKYLASAGEDTFINIWNPTDLSWLHLFRGHRNIVTGIVFQKKHHQLFSASHDKTIKVWNLDEMAYVETLFGHEDAVLGIDSLLRDHAVSCGGRDRSVRLWKIGDESQLVFHSSNISSSFDCVTMLNEDYFLAGGDDGSLSVFNVRKKKPLALRTRAHVKTENSPQGCCDESWVSAVASLPYTDLVASGSCDGCIKLWRCEKNFTSLMPVHSIQVNGFVNGLKFSSNGEYLIAAIGQEHRLGRWWQMKTAKNAVYVIPITTTITNNNVVNNINDESTS